MEAQDNLPNFREVMGFDAGNEVMYEDDATDNSIPDVQVGHLEPWERGTRKTQGMTGMCGGVRGVGAGGVISTAFCLLFKMFTLKITRKQLVSMINSTQSVYLRGLGFMYIRYTQPPSDLWSWMEPYLVDEEEIDPRSGGGDKITISQLVRMMLTKLDFYGTLFPRIPVPIQKKIEQKFGERSRQMLEDNPRYARDRSRSRDRAGSRTRSRTRSRSPRDRRRSRSGSRDRNRRRERDRDPKSTRERSSKDKEVSSKHLSEGDRKHGSKRHYRCKHHLRHHHCRKHRTACPSKAKRDEDSSKTKTALSTN